MDNNLLQIKVVERLNKLASEDYDNVECWQIAEAFNKAQIEFCRNQIHGNNLRQEGDESSKMLIDDMQILLTRVNMGTLTTRPKYQETPELPEDYLFFKKVSCYSVSECCDNREMRVKLEEVADVDELLADELSKPSMEWGETFATMFSNRIQIYTNDEFEIERPQLHYYRRPLNVEFIGCVNPSDDSDITVDVICEFKDDIVELIIDEAVVILAGDLELFNNHQRSKESASSNN